MFKKFSPKEDIATSTSVKSSIQRTIRLKLLSQIPLLSLPALAPPKLVHSDSEEDSESEEEKREMGGNKKLRESKKEAKGRGPGKGKKGRSGGGRKEVEEEVEPDFAEEGEEIVTLLDILWPKKEGLTLIKW